MTADLDLTTIRAFVAVVDAGDFTAAARALHVTRSGVGKAIVRLETSLGTKLLHRTTRRVSTTSDGAVFYDRCVRILADLAEAENAVGQRQQEPRGILKLSVPDAYGRWRIMPILATFMRRWPDVGVEVRFSDRIDDLSRRVSIWRSGPAATRPTASSRASSIGSVASFAPLPTTLRPGAHRTVPIRSTATTCC